MTDVITTLSLTGILIADLTTQQFSPVHDVRENMMLPME
jgi:hypothetical protein